MLTFAQPWFLLLLVLLPLLAWWYSRTYQRRSATLRYSNLDLMRSLPQRSRYSSRHILFGLRWLAIALVIVALARPQSGQTEEEVTTEGIDIMLALDISSSMLAEDFRPKNRIEAAKLVAEQFITGRRSDRIGMVVFAARSFTQCPLTLDYGILINFLKKVDVGMVDDGTAIGLGMATAIDRLRNSKAKSKVVILLTDGVNNAGEIDPLTAARVAQAFNIRFYTIGVGTRGQALYPVQDPIFGKRYVPMPVEIDEATLTKIAELTKGRYFRATDRQSLEKIFAEIDRLEKTKIEVKQFTRYRELFVYWLAVALGLVFVEIVLAGTVFRKIP
ncbi:MAG: VWA domain-containing protein [candidate division KSB1 bacterium]|nr:VWA domain-containing protein [candidate division KSB1 bacterium]MDZ7274509.1 VWA domain-containing protein [candidate division KSB1 bacterium]MDZ7284830.1 VWA domain-containing protein [candidate division KSB1 bacterium]MDZ7297750.1 VWA domain-containing protein [candidate division KSB1 bacterium]MDZ7348616.1 VWA domain-containing protein [candidate division KSB1 bacterium]